MYLYPKKTCQIITSQYVRNDDNDDGDTTTTTATKC